MQTVGCSQKEPYKRIQVESLTRIAHAGGTIDGIRYTNSLEALDRSYTMGFRTFELDLIKDADENFVAAHSWTDWSNMVGWPDPDIKPTTDEFKSKKLWGEYTPMVFKDESSYDVVDWFNEHPDANLIADKVWDLDLVLDLFPNWDNLYVEIFDEDRMKIAYDRGFKNGIASFNTINDLDRTDDIVEMLRKYDIKFVTAKSVENNQKMKNHYDAIRKMDIKIFMMEFPFNENDFIEKVKLNAQWTDGIYIDHQHLLKDVDDLFKTNIFL